MKKILVTGGLGYLGGRVVKSLLEQGCHVRIGSRQTDRCALPGWLQNQDIVNIDLLNPELTATICAEMDGVVHLAALDEVECATNPEQALIINGYGTKVLAESAARAGVKKFLYMSTAHVYGAPLSGVLTEDTVPCPRHPYAISKLSGEYFALSASGNTAMETIVIRLSNGFGVPVHPNINRWKLVVNDFCRQIITTGNIYLNSSGAQFRDFVTFTDVVAGIRHLIDMPSNFGDGKIFNLGGKNPMRVIEMARFVANRAYQTLNVRPEIIRPAQCCTQFSDEKDSFIDYRIDKLEKTGFHLSGDMSEEIDAMLCMCQETFGGGY